MVYTNMAILSYFNNQLGTLLLLVGLWPIINMKIESYNIRK